MKHILPLFSLVLAAGCAAKSPYDVTAEQVKQHRVARGGPGAPIDENHLPPGAKKEVQTFKKGDRLPDGSIATGPAKMVRVTVGGPGGVSSADQRITIQNGVPPQGQ